MDDDSCVMKYIEIVPLERNEDCSNVTGVKCEPVTVKVGDVSGSYLVSCTLEFYFIYLIM